MSASQFSQTVGDHIWPTLKRDLDKIASQEPALATYISRLVPHQSNFQDALALRLARGLADTDMSEDHITEILIEGLKIEPKNTEAAAMDLLAIRSRDPASRNHAHAFLNYKGFHALQVARIANVFWRRDRFDLAVWLSNRASVVFGPDIHPAVQLGTGIMLDHGSGIVIGETAIVEDDVTILQSVTLGGTGKTSGERHPKVRQGVMIGAGANIIGNIQLGPFSKIAAGSVVLKDVPAHCTVAGIPAQIVRLHRPMELVGNPPQANRVC